MKKMFSLLLIALLLIASFSVCVNANDPTPPVVYNSRLAFGNPMQSPWKAMYQNPVTGAYADLPYYIGDEGDKYWSLWTDHKEGNRLTYVGPDFMQPQMHWDTNHPEYRAVRGFAAPYTGEITISTEGIIEKYLNCPAKDSIQNGSIEDYNNLWSYGPKIRITKNGTKIWPENEDWQVVSGFDSDLTITTTLNINKGDMLYFELDGNHGDGYANKYFSTTNWVPIVTYNSIAVVETYNSALQYSQTGQGPIWYYASIEKLSTLAAKDSYIMLDATSTSIQYGVPVRAFAAGLERFGSIGAGIMEPSGSWEGENIDRDAALIFISPKSGSATIYADGGNIQGHNWACTAGVQILVNKQKVWPQGSDYLLINGTTSVSAPPLSIELKKGDMVEFIASNMGTKYTDQLAWTPVVDIMNPVDEPDSQLTYIDNDFSGNEMPKEVNFSNFEVSNGKIITPNNVISTMIHSYGNSLWDDYTVSFDTKLTAIGLYGATSTRIRFKDDANGYFIFVSPDSMTFTRKIASIDTVLATKDLPLSVDLQTGANIKITAKGSKFDIYLNNVLFTTVFDYIFPNGSVGLGTYNAAVEFDNLKISRKPSEPKMEIEALSLINTSTSANTEMLSGESLVGKTSVTASAHLVSDFSLTETTGAVILAVYAPDNTLKKVSSSGVLTSCPGISRYIYATVDLSDINDLTGYTAKVFVWDQVSGLMPLGAGIERP